MSDFLSFECTLCGECCCGDQTIRLNGEDLALISQFLSKNLDHLFAQRIVDFITDDNRFLRPVLRFKGFGKGKNRLRFCPFLENSWDAGGTLRGFCRLHPRFKPLVCALAPWAREVDLATGIEVWKGLAPVEGCPGMGRGPLKARGDDIKGLQERLDREKEWFSFWEEFQVKSSWDGSWENLLSLGGADILCPRS